ncbi:sulfatase-like hydrolase/transferase [Actinomadura madurae]|uniref:sulfatase-like hydrolase/transferase n=1 Tax=Actinomadura madurae TaxID=1993 RepID=UPI0020D228AB|nr:sulfatase-like hydrolase/transferase [Actinomadura madurae]MCQ0015388.1 sulfatase-like hydrolase/transferase [Actinomadura madurae]
MKIIYVDVDTLRPDHTQPYGYRRPITPNLAALAERGVRFDRYYCSDSPCLPSRTALTCGQFGITSGVVGHAGEAARFRLDAGHRPEPGRPLLGQALTRARLPHGGGVVLRRAASGVLLPRELPGEHTGHTGHRR